MILFQSQNEKEHEKMKQLKSKIELLNKQLVTKRSIIAQLEEDYDKLPKNINRFLFNFLYFFSLIFKKYCKYRKKELHCYLIIWFIKKTAFH